MDFSKCFLFFFAIFLVVNVSSASPRWKVFKSIEHLGQNIRDGIIKAEPAVKTIGEAATIIKAFPG